MRIPNAALLVALVTLVACQSSDVGTPCRLIPAITDASGNVVPNPIDDQNVTADFVATNVTSCDDLVCIKSPPVDPTKTDTGYCSRPCVSNADCSQSSTGLVCRPLTFDQNVINQLPADVQAQYTQGLGSIGLSTYCARPQH